MQTATAPCAHVAPCVQSASVSQGNAHLPAGTLHRWVPHSESLLQLAAAEPGAASEPTGGAGAAPTGDAAAGVVAGAEVGAWHAQPTAAARTENRIGSAHRTVERRG